jgi:putative serine protease PepD
MLVVLAALLLSACGGGGEKVVTETTTTNAAPAPKQVVVQTASGDFNPVEIYKKAAPGVVTVLSVFGGSDSAIGGASAGQGSGFVVNKDGEIVTNAHVVSEGEGSDLTEADQVYVEFADRNRVSAEVLGVDPFADVALLKIDPEGLDIQPLELGDDATLPVGAPVAAIGSPFSEVQSLTVGIVSAKDRSVKSLTQFKIENSIQTDAAINPGNSGGPLVDLNGAVVGINSSIASTSSGADGGQPGNIGIGFAVPSDVVVRVANDLITTGKSSNAQLGVRLSGSDGELPTSVGVPLGEVVSGGPAEKAGLRAGDVVTKINNYDTTTTDGLIAATRFYAPGTTVKLTFVRDGGSPQTADVTLGTA